MFPITSCCLIWQKCAMLTSLGVLEEPLGNARLHVARLMAALLQNCTPAVAAELCRLNTMDLLLVSVRGVILWGMGQVRLWCRLGNVV